jgi:archaemetzincin
MSEINLIPLQFGESSHIEFLAGGISDIAGLPTVIQNCDIDLNLFYDANRSQYDAVRIIQEFEKDTTDLTLVFTTVDLFMPIFTFVFGLAKLDGTVGIVSTHRLDNLYYGLPENPVLLTERLLKEAIHEFGHLVGLRHCPQFDCVMASSTSADEIDIKSPYYCDSCRNRFEQNLITKRRA